MSEAKGHTGSPVPENPNAYVRQAEGRAYGTADQVAPGRDAAATQLMRPKPQTAREIHIKPVGHGFIVQVDCQTIVIESVNKLIGLLSVYLTNPAETEDRYCNGTLL